MKKRLVRPHPINIGNISTEKPKEFISPITSETGTDLDIFICSHVNFDPRFTNPIYKVLIGEETEFDDSKTNLEVFRETKDSKYYYLNRALGESSRMYWVAKNVALKKYVGFVHYGASFSFGNDVPDINKEMEGCDVLTALERGLRNTSLYEFFYQYHDKNDLIEVFTVIPKLFPEYSIKEVMSCLSEPMVVQRNMFIMKSMDFLRFVDFWDKIIDWFNKKHDIKNDDDVLKYVSEKSNVYKDEFHFKIGILSDMKYQARLHGFLIERLATVFFRHNFKNIKNIPFSFNKEYKRVKHS